VHAVARRIGDDYIGLAVLRDKCVVKDVFHVANKELTIGDIIAPALILASAMASGTASTPMTFLAFLETNCAMVPVPVYKS
jgi:hypothetical protein